MDDTESIRSFTMIFELLDPVKVNAKGRVGCPGLGFWLQAARIRFVRGAKSWDNGKFPIAARPHENEMRR